MRLERWLYTVPLRFRSLFRRNQVEQELDEEFRYHIERLTEEHVVRGMAPADARLAALRAMHGVEQRKEECRDTRSVRIVEDALQDLRYAGRTLRRSPGFAAAAIVTLTLGIGSSVAVFTIVNGVLLQPLPFPQSERLFLLVSRLLQDHGDSPVARPRFHGARRGLHGRCRDRQPDGGAHARIVRRRDWQAHHAGRSSETGRLVDGDWRG